MSQRPTTLKRGTIQYWTIATYNSSGVLVDADSNPTIALRKNGSAHTGTTTVTKRAATTGLYDCTFNPSGEINSDQFQVEETATISSQAYVNIWNFDVNEALPQGMSSLSIDTNTGSVGADLIAINQEAITSTSGNSNYMADRFVDFYDHSSANSRTSGNFNTTTPNNAGITANGNAIAGLNNFDPASDTVTTDTASRDASKADVSSLATSTEVTNVGSAVAGNASAIAVVDTVVDAIKVTTDKLDTALVIDGSVYQYTANALELAPSGGGGGGDATAANQTAISNAIAALNDFDPSSDTVANVTTVGTCVVNSDMRGTDNANTLAPANGDITGIKAKTDSLTFTGSDVNANVQAGASDATAANQVAIQNAIAALNDFDPGSDTVANVADVALVAVCTTNSDMRGTDSANTVAPDNAGIAANGVAVAALNDFDPATDVVADVANVATTAVCVSNTDMRGTDNANTVAPDNAGIASNATALATTTKTGVQYTATAQSGDTIQVTLS